MTISFIRFLQLSQSLSASAHLNFFHSSFNNFFKLFIRCNTVTHMLFFSFWIYCFFSLTSKDNFALFISFFLVWWSTNSFVSKIYRQHMKWRKDAPDEKKNYQDHVEIIIVLLLSCSYAWINLFLFFECQMGNTLYFCVDINTIARWLIGKGRNHNSFAKRVRIVNANSTKHPIFYSCLFFRSRFNFPNHWKVLRGVLYIISKTV